MQGPNKGPDHFQRKYQRSRTRVSRLRDKLAVSENARANLAQENQGLSQRVRELQTTKLRAVRKVNRVKVAMFALRRDFRVKNRVV
jgi:hypothetical protein